MKEEARRRMCECGQWLAIEALLFEDGSLRQISKWVGKEPATVRILRRTSPFVMTSERFVQCRNCNRRVKVSTFKP